MKPDRSARRLRWGLLLAALALRSPAAEPDRSPAGRIRFVPEAERPLEHLVVGTNARNGRYFLLPELGPLKGLDAEDRRDLASDLFALDVELSHGALFSRLPSYTRLYVAVPGEAERASFRRYLLERCGWTAADADQRVRFFEVSTPLLWTRDAGKILGYDEKDRVVVASSPSDHALYRDFVDRLTRAFPDRFALHRLERGVSSEGGDAAVVRLADSSLAYLVGHHRFLRYFGRGVAPAAAMSQDEILQAQEAFSRSLLGLPVHVLPEAALRGHDAMAPELFHLDMLTTVLSGNGVVTAFVPTFGAAPVDRLSGRELPPETRARVQRSYDEVARQLTAMGYTVRRVPFADDPSRAPVNVMRFADAAGRPSLFLPKYPQHLGMREDAPQAQLDAVLRSFRETAARLNADPSASRGSWREAIEAVWSGLQSVRARTSALFEAKRKVFEDRGYRVVEVPMYPWGGGGLHCITMH